MNFGNIRSCCEQMRISWFSKQKWDGEVWFQILAELSDMDLEMQRDFGVNYVKSELLNVPRPIIMQCGIYEGGRGLYNCVSSSMLSEDVIQSKSDIGDFEFQELPILIGDSHFLYRKEAIFQPKEYNSLHSFNLAMFGPNKTVWCLPNSTHENQHFPIRRTHLNIKYVVFIGEYHNDIPICKVDNHLTYFYPKLIEFRGNLDGRSVRDKGVINLNSLAHPIGRLAIFGFDVLKITGWKQPTVKAQCGNKHDLSVSYDLPRCNDVIFENVEFPNHNQKSFADIMNLAQNRVSIINCVNFKHIIKACSKTTRDIINIVE